LNWAGEACLFAWCLAWDGCFELLGFRSGLVTILRFFNSNILLYRMISFVWPHRPRHDCIRAAPVIWVRLMTDTTYRSTLIRPIDAGSMNIHTHIHAHAAQRSTAQHIPCIRSPIDPRGTHHIQQAGAEASSASASVRALPCGSVPTVHTAGYPTPLFPQPPCRPCRIGMG
jgi:hypothetical protein